MLTWKKESVLDDQLDPAVAELVRVLDEFPTVATIGAGGSDDEWYVLFEVEPADPEAEVAVPSEWAWRNLEYLAYMFNSKGLCLGAERNANVEMLLYAPAPHLNEPGRMIRFEVRGWREGDDGVDADEVAAAIRKHVAEGFYTPGGEVGPAVRPAG